jgi:ubiquinone/menaquinone biosynthesis C-methylase UbiE
MGQDREIETGVLWCRSCRSYFPVEEGILELVSGALADAPARDRFWSAHKTRLEALELEPPHAAQVSRPEDEAVAKQREHFDWYADNETQTYEAYEATPFWRAADRIAFGEWRQSVAPGARLLDVGCAQGRSTFPWMDLDLDIVGFDISRSLIRQAGQRYRRARPRARASFFVADATRFPLRSSRFDYVLGYGVLHHFPDPASTCREIARVLKSGGVFFSSENNQTVFRGIFDWLQRIRPAWHEEAGDHALISERDLRSWLEPAGCGVSVKTSVFLPPHLANALGHAAADRLLRAADRVAGAIPFLRKQGGLILARAEKKSPQCLVTKGSLQRTP